MKRKILVGEKQENSNGKKVPNKISLDCWEQMVFGEDMPKYLEDIVGKCMPQYVGALGDPTIKGYWIILHKDKSFTVKLHRVSDLPDVDHQSSTSSCKKKKKR